MRAIIALAPLLVLAGCGTSPKTHYFTLTAANTASAAHQSALATPVTVAAVHVPASLDRRQMVTRTGGNSVSISGTDRWAGPLGRMARNVLSQDLAARLSPSSVIMPDAPAPDHVRQIVVTLSRFGPSSGGGVVLEANWSVITASDQKPSLSRNVHFTEQATGSGGGAIAAAMSRLLGKLAAQMASALAAS